MEKLNTQDICCDCQLGILLENCKQCLFNVFRNMDKYAPFSWDEPEWKAESNNLKTESKN